MARGRSKVKKRNSKTKQELQKDFSDKVMKTEAIDHGLYIELMEIREGQNKETLDDLIAYREERKQAIESEFNKRMDELNEEISLLIEAEASDGLDARRSELKAVEERLVEVEKNIKIKETQIAEKMKDSDVKVSDAEAKAAKLVEVANEEAETIREKAQREAEKQAKRNEQERRILEWDKEDIEDARQDLVKLREKWKACNPDTLETQKIELELLRKQVGQMTQSNKILIDENTSIKGELARLKSEDVDDLRRDLEALKERNQKLEDRQIDYLSEEQLRDLKTSAGEADGLRQKNYQLEMKVNALNLELEKQAAIRSEKNLLSMQVERLSIMSQRLTEELEQNKALMENYELDACPRLQSEDEAIKLLDPIQHRISKPSVKTLRELAKHVQSYAASQLDLYYKIEDIAAFLGGMASSRMLVLQGMSGTGKTSLPVAFSKAISGEHKVVPVESSWRDRNELLGYYNDFNKIFKATDFTAHMYRASDQKFKDIPNFIVLDEMNLSRVEYYFADFLSIMQSTDPTDWQIRLADRELSEPGRLPNLVDRRSLKVNENIWFIGTANEDESTFEISDKVYDRAQVLNLDKRHKFTDVEERRDPIFLPVERIERLFREAQGEHVLIDDDKDILEQLSEYAKEYFGLDYGYRVLKQIEKFGPVYVASSGKDMADAIDYQFSTKVLRKLDNKFLKPEKLEQFEEAAKLLGMERCADFAKRKRNEVG